MQEKQITKSQKTEHVFAKKLRHGGNNNDGITDWKEYSIAAL